MKWQVAIGILGATLDQDKSGGLMELLPAECRSLPAARPVRQPGGVGSHRLDMDQSANGAVLVVMQLTHKP